MSHIDDLRLDPVVVSDFGHAHNSPPPVPSRESLVGQ
jgi:hypothetical protein